MKITSILTDKQKAGRFYVGMSQYNQPYTPQYSNGGLFLTEDYGKNWERVYDGAVFSLYEDYQNPRNVYVNTKFGLLKFLDTLTVTSIYDYSNEEISNTYFLEQNYPNPFNPITTIEYVIPNGVRDLVTLKVYDILGNEVATLVNEYRESGRYKIEFDANSLASGVYIYKLTAGSFVSNRKMLLIK
ncbi:MAG: T9SS type A sorting domain-containing protein [Ignavibacterium album]|nr:T9SS type A sorting domain-containing protein [Ignavibacterium album]